jgi:hypothetical protein
MTDVKVAIGLTTIQNTKEQQLILHARRICSAEQELYNTGAAVSRKYIEFEEDHEEKAIQLIETRRREKQEQQQTAAGAGAATEEEYNYYSECDSLPSIVPFPSTSFANHHHPQGSEIRRLCVKIAIAKSNNEDITAEEIYEKMCRDVYYYNDDEYHCHNHYNRGGNDDTFSSTPMDDVYTQRRMGIMRHMSSQ